MPEEELISYFKESGFSDLPRALCTLSSLEVLEELLEVRKSDFLKEIGVSLRAELLDVHEVRIGTTLHAYYFTR
jgi:hypothetical protein